VPLRDETVIKLLAFFRRDAHADIDTLSAAADGSLESGRALALEAHLASCEACAVRLAELRAVRSALAAMPAAEAPRSFRLRQSDVEVAATRKADRGAGQVLRLMPVMSAAAVVLFAVLVGVDMQSGSSGRSAASRAVTGAPAAERAKDTLANAPVPQTAAADRAPAAPAPAPSGGAPGIEPVQTAAGGTFPAAPASGSATASSAEAAPARPTSAVFRDTSTEGGTGGDHTALRIAEAIAAALATGAGVAAVFGWRRSRGVHR